MLNLPGIPATTSHAQVVTEINYKEKINFHQKKKKNAVTALEWF